MSVRHRGASLRLRAWYLEKSDERAVSMTAKRALRVVSVLLVSLVPSGVRADGRVQFLSDRLHYPPLSGQIDDFRVRTNAALALGASNDDAAVGPLCAGLDDPSDVVREAAAVGLKRLGRPSAVDCLKRRADVESKGPVKVEIQHALDALGGAPSGGSGAPAVVEGARFYVALSPVNNATTRPSGDIERVVKDAI